ncbi:MAG: class I SAM-dependent methyltransferase [Gammaproteobacteria bacterium]|nr:class I SAM-dependent methyltransferase [Gammaproteobacteria bacterium]
MLLHDGTELTKEQIEELNANGPYSMAIWHSGEVSVGNEEGLSGRSEHFMKLIRESILKNFSIDEIKDLSILDIGCNDGWFLHQLSDLPFSKMVGIEPRQKNINKGKVVRELLKLDNNVDYRVGDVESLNGETFDIVICVGVLYHVESIPVALRRIKEACEKMVFIESRVISSSYITDELKEEIEMRDLVYQFNEETCGVTAQKFESAYHDGSSAHTTIVNIPSTESLVMNLKYLGFEDVDILADNKFHHKQRYTLGGVCLTARKYETGSTLDSFEDAWISDYEAGLKNEILPREIVEPLYNVFVKNDDSSLLSSQNLKIYEFLTNPKINYTEDLLSKDVKSKFSEEIIKNWKYSPSNKISLEYGKTLSNLNEGDRALEILSNIISNLNADWRASYRAFKLMSEIYNEKDNSELSKKYLDLCLTANPKYPTT